MKSNVTGTILILLLVLGIAALIYSWWAGYLDLVLAAIVIVIFALLIIFFLLYFVLGIFYWATKKDVAHTAYSSTLDDITEVDREMSNGDKKD